MLQQHKAALADYAPQTYRRLNPRVFRQVAAALFEIADDPADRSTVRRWIVEDVISGVRDTDEPIKTISPEVFAAGIIEKTGIPVSSILASQDILPVVELGDTAYAIDLTTSTGLRPLSL